MLLTSEESWLAYVKRTKGHLPGPSSLYEHGFMDGAKNSKSEIEIKRVVVCSEKDVDMIAGQVNEDLKEQLAKKDTENEHLKAKMTKYDQWLSEGVYFTTDDYTYHVEQHKKQLAKKDADLKLAVSALENALDPHAQTRHLIHAEKILTKLKEGNK